MVFSGSDVPSQHDTNDACLCVSKTWRFKDKPAPNAATARKTAEDLRCNTGGSIDERSARHGGVELPEGKGQLGMGRAHASTHSPLVGEARDLAGAKLDVTIPLLWSTPKAWVPEKIKAPRHRRTKREEAIAVLLQG